MEIMDNHIMSPNLTQIFPQDFRHKLINFPKETLANLFKLGQEAMYQFLSNELNALDPLVCENACHIRAFALWHMTQKYKDKKARSALYWVVDALDNFIKTIDALPPINEHSGQTIENYLQEHHLSLELDKELLFDVQFIFLSHLLTLTKKALPSSSFMLHEKTDLDALDRLGLVHSKIKSLVSCAQKELSAMSCQFIQQQSQLCDNQALTQLLVTRHDDHKRSYLPQYSTAKVILLNALQQDTPLIIKISRFVQHRYYDELILGFKPSPNKNDFYCTKQFNEDTKAAIICEGIINYPDRAETPQAYLNRLNHYSLIQLLLANFAAHPQFSGNLRHTPCIYKEALDNACELKSHIAQEWDEFNHHAYLAKKEGCSLENPNLLFLNHVFCDSIAYYSQHNLSTAVSQDALEGETEL